MIADIRVKLSEHAPRGLGAAHDDRGQAAVLVPIVNDDEARLILTERAGTLARHGGEVAFPGGKQDDTDTSLIHTALRETHEEIGVGAEHIEVLGTLRPFVSKFGLLVTPVVAVVSAEVIYQPNPDEIASIFEVPLPFFAEATPIRIDELDRHGVQDSVAAFDFEGYEIWGLTSMIINEFLNVVTPASSS